MSDKTKWMLGGALMAVCSVLSSLRGELLISAGYAILTGVYFHVSIYTTK